MRGAMQAAAHNHSRAQVYRSILMSEGLNPAESWPDNTEWRDNYMKAAAQLCALFRCHGDQRDDTDDSEGRGQRCKNRLGHCVRVTRRGMWSQRSIIKIVTKY